VPISGRFGYVLHDEQQYEPLQKNDPEGGSWTAPELSTKLCAYVTKLQLYYMTKVLQGARME
jgi:hypothetical protein